MHEHEGVFFPSSPEMVAEMELVNRPNANKDIYRNNIGRDTRFVLANRKDFWFFWFSSVGASQHLALRTVGMVAICPTLFLQKPQFKALSHIAPLSTLVFARPWILICSLENMAMWLQKSVFDRIKVKIIGKFRSQTKE